MIRNTIRTDITMFIECFVEIIEGKPIVILTVRRDTVRPYCLAETGICPEGVYLLHGAFSVPTSETIILKMIKEASGNYYRILKN